MAKEINIIAISYGRNLFDADNIERKRMELCAQEVGVYNMIVFTKRSDNFSVTRTHDELVLHPTNSLTKIHMIFDAVRIGSRLLKEHAGQWVITTQDPFEAGLVGYILTRRFTVPLNIQEHADFFSTKFWRLESGLNRVRFVFGKWLLPKADSVRVVSNRIESAVKRIGVAPQKILRLAVCTDNSVAEDTSDIDLHSEYPNASVIILSMARFVPQKNLSLLITAFEKLHKKNFQSKLILIGGGPEEQKLRNLVVQKKLEQAVVFKAWTDTPQAYMSSADIYALSSNYEGWARVLVQAMLVGTPVVTTDVGCANEVLLDGKHGLVVGVGDIDAFPSKLITLAEDTELRRRFGIAAKQDIAATHVTVEAYAQAWAGVLLKTTSTL